MSRKKKLPKNRSKYRCPCGNPFNTKMVVIVEAGAAADRKRGMKIPPRLPHSCGRCRKLSCLEGEKFRYLTPAEELSYRIDFPGAARSQDRAMAVNAPDFIGLIPAELAEKEGDSDG